MQRPGLTIALDADWGTGKSFFVKRWVTDLSQAGHPVIYFDAWENDIGDEAVIALMAAIRTELDRWMSKLPTDEKIKEIAKEATRSALGGLRRAVIPASRVIATGLFKKATGAAFDEIVEALHGPTANLGKGLTEATSDSLEAGLDELFAQALDDHNRRSAAILNFRSSIASLIDLLEQQVEAQIPVFVFVDEVDRCRPTYAIRLLEEIKHIFGIGSICFVVSTNLSQLKEAVRAIYGSGFDGHRYLKRFFDHQYTLPEPNNENFSAQLLRDSLLESRQVATGLHASLKPETKNSIAVIADAFDLDLRSLKQVFLMAESVAAVVPNENHVFVLWLFFLCALRHRTPESFDALLSPVDRAKFFELCNNCMKRDIRIEYTSQRHHYERGTKSSVQLVEVLWSYYEWSQADLIKLRDHEINHYDYPSSNLREIVREAPTTYFPSQKYEPSIAQYMKWVKYTGMTRDRSDDQTTS